MFVGIILGSWEKGMQTSDKKSFTRNIKNKD